VLPGIVANQMNKGIVQARLRELEAAQRDVFLEAAAQNILRVKLLANL
jgi:hypothetical protein